MSGDQKTSRRPWGTFVAFAAFGIFVAVGFAMGFEPAEAVGHNAALLSVDMLRLLPPVFVLIGLFHVWVPREVIERNLGTGAGARALFWSVLLGGVTVGPMIVALPIAVALSRKGASLVAIFTYLGASATCRIPMTLFEASFLGVRFTVVRYVVSLPLLLLVAWGMGRSLEARGYELHDG